AWAVAPVPVTMSLITSLVGGLPLGTVTVGFVPSCAAPVGCAGAVPVAVGVAGGAAAVDAVDLSLPPPPQPASRMAQATEMSAARRTAAHPSAVRGPAHAVLASARSGEKSRCPWFARANSTHVSTRPGRSVASHGESVHTKPHSAMSADAKADSCWG